MYVTSTTSIKDIKQEIKSIKEELNKPLTEYDREALREELRYLESFLPVERF